MNTSITQSDASIPGLIQNIPGLDQAHVWASAYLSPVRLDILMHLSAHGEQAVIKIADALELDRSSISHALRCLRDDDIVRVRSIDRRRLYRITDRIRIESTGDRFNLTVTREDGWEVSIKRALPKPAQTVTTEPKPQTPELVVRQLAKKLEPRSYPIPDPLVG